jgi:hypothetical protein
MGDRSHRLVWVHVLYCTETVDMKWFSSSPPVIRGRDARRFVKELLRERTPEEIEKHKQMMQLVIEIFRRHGPPKSVE